MNSLARNVIEWWSRRRPKPLDQLLIVEWDDEQVDVRVLERLEADWNQSFKWSDVVRVCFKDAGIYSSDVLLIEVAGRERPVVVPTEAKGGSELFGALAGRGLFPEDVWRKAIGETGGATHCWPPRNA
jgi:hypothetical protein